VAAHTKPIDSRCLWQQFDLFRLSKVFVEINTKQDGMSLNVEIDFRYGALTGVRHGDVHFLVGTQSAHDSVSGRADEFCIWDTEEIKPAREQTPISYGLRP